MNRLIGFSRAFCQFTVPSGYLLLVGALYIGKFQRSVLLTSRMIGREILKTNPKLRFILRFILRFAFRSVSQET